MAHWARRNSRRGSRHNIAFHYDLGNDFYRLWLDPSLTYSSALFDTSDDLSAAQARKLDAILARTGTKSGERILEIGEQAASKSRAQRITLEDALLTLAEERDHLLLRDAQRDGAFAAVESTDER